MSAPLLAVDAASDRELGNGNARPQKRPRRQTFKRAGEYWTIRFGGSVFRMKDSKGMHYLALLIAHPGMYLAATALSRCVDHAEKFDLALATRPIDAVPLQLRENARVRATRALRVVLMRIARQHPQLGGHLKVSIRTGHMCSYQPDPNLTVRWEL